MSATGTTNPTLPSANDSQWPTNGKMNISRKVPAL